MNNQGIIPARIDSADGTSFLRYTEGGMEERERTEDNL